MRFFLCLLLASVANAQQPPAGVPYAWYQPAGLKAEHAAVSAWHSSAGEHPERSLTRITGRPQHLLVSTADGDRSIVRFNGRDALWQAVGSWGTLTGPRTVLVLARLPGDSSGVLLDGSTKAGSLPFTWQRTGFAQPVRAAVEAGQGDWQARAFVFPAGTSPLGGLIVGANVAQQEGLKCDVAELLIYPRALTEAECQQSVDWLAARWKQVKVLPDDRQPQPLQRPRDPRLFRTTLQTQGANGVHTYRIPGLTTSARGTLIAVYDLRHKGGGDLPADIDVGLQRSTDQGATWSPVQRIMDFDASVPGSQGNGVGDPAVLADQRTGSLFVVALWSQGPRAWNGSGPGLTPDETGQLMLVRSDDDGVTWSKPVSLTPQVKDPAWRLCFNGPGNGIQLKDGTLVFPAQYKVTVGDAAARSPAGKPHSCFIASRDGGRTWRISPAAIPDGIPTSEAAIAELSDGGLLLSMRNESRSGERAWAKWQRAGSGDGKPTADILQGRWSESWLRLPDPTCMASLIRHPQGLLVFSNPADSQQRRMLTVRTSRDDGQSWSRGQVLDPDGAQYSSLTVLSDGQLGILYESTEARGLVFVRFPLDWVLEGERAVK